jgi:hypothetical protein
MAEADLYEPVKQCLERSLIAVGKRCYLEVAAKRGFSETAKQAIPQGKEIVFSFLRHKPDILGFIENQYTKDLITVEVKEACPNLDDVYQAKLYKEVFEARYGFLITGDPITEELKRLCRTTSPILHSAGDGTYRFLALAQFDPAAGKFVEWFEENPFTQSFYWT